MLFFSVLLIIFQSCSYPVVDLIPIRTEKCLENIVYDTIIIQNGMEIVREVVDKNCLIGSGISSSLELNKLDGKAELTNSWKGKIKVINLWFAECKPCIAEMPLLNDLKKEIANNSVLFYSINLKNTPTEIFAFLEKYEFNYTHYYSSDPIMKKEWGLLWGYPMTIVMDENNILRGIFENFKGLDSKDDMMNLIRNLNI